MFTKHFWTEGPGSFALAILFALTIRWGFMEAYVIPSGSMLPSLLINDHIFVNKSVYGLRIPFSEKWLFKFGTPKRGEVIVFKYPRDMSTFFIKRVVGVAGDSVMYNKGILSVNGKPMEYSEPVGEGSLRALSNEALRGEHHLGETKADYVHRVENISDVVHDVLLRKGDYEDDTFGPIEVPAGKLFVMGDNRNRSSDSRVWGFVPEDYILGRAMFVWLSCDNTLPYLTFLCNPLSVRWSRFFHSIHSAPEKGPAIRLGGETPEGKIESSATDMETAS